LITAAVTVLTLTNSTTARAVGSAFNGPQAIGVLAGAGLLGGITCWTVELANAESRFDDAPRVIRDDDYERTGWYAGAKVVAATEFLDEAEEEKTIEEFFDPFNVRFKMNSNPTSASVSFHGGRRCNTRFSVELQFDWIDDFGGKIISTDPDPDVVTNNVKFSPIVVTTNLKLYLLTGRFQPYGLVGVGLIAIDATTTSVIGVQTHQTTGLLAVRFGGGLDFYLTRSWVLSAQADYVYSATDIETLDIFNVGFGVSYRY
jgi:opacity protein-like surface antigen